MKCSHCSAELPASANHCYQCGQPVPTTVESVPFERQHTTFSYLPANTPPWPTAIPTLPHAQSSASVTAHVSEQKTEEKARRSVSAILGMIALALLIPLFGAALTMGVLFARGQIGARPATAATTKPVAASVNPTSTPAVSNNQLPTPTSSKKISDTDLNILLQYPNNWDTEKISKSTTDTTLNIHPHDTQLPISFYVIHMTDSVSSQFQTVDDVNQARLDVVKQQGALNFQLLQSTEAQPTIGGAKWAMQEATFQTNDGSTFHLTVISTQRNKSYYSLLFLSQDVYYNEAMSKYIQPMIQSIQFLK